MATRAERRAVQDAQRAQKALKGMSASACELVLVRHGQTTWNVEARLQGQLVPGPPLDEVGQRQAAVLAERLVQELPFDTLYSSDLLRCTQTAEVVGAALGLPAVQTAQLRERHLGDIQGLTYAEAEQQLPEAYAALMSRSPTARIPGGGESVVDLQARVAAALETITRRNPGKRVLIISHGGFLHATHVHATGHAPPGKNINGSINTLRIDPGQSGEQGRGAAEDGQQAGAGEGGRRCTWALVRWGDVDHLHEVGFLHKAFGGGTRG